ncbi:MAG: hypothetical protein ACHQF2_06390 [Flavobacteriales bacterium]
MKKRFLLFPALLLLAACGGNQEAEKLPTFEEIQKEANAWREKNIKSLNVIASGIDIMRDYVKGNTDSLQKDDSTKGVGLTLEFRDGNTESNFNTEVVHMAELDTSADGHRFSENDWFENVYDFAKNGYHKTYAMETNPAQFWAILKEDIKRAEKIEYVILYRTVYKLMPEVKESMFEMGADIENAFLFSMKTGDLIRSFNLMGINDQEVSYMIYEGDDSRTMDSYKAAVKTNFYTKLRESMEKTLKDRFEVKGNVRTMYESY